MINLTDYNDFFIFLGSLLIIGGVIYFFLRHRLQNIFITEQEAERLISEEKISRLKISNQISSPQKLFLKPSGNVDSQTIFKKLSVILLIIIIAGFLFNQFLMWRMGSSEILNKLFSMSELFSSKISINITRK